MPKTFMLRGETFRRKFLNSNRFFKTFLQIFYQTWKFAARFLEINKLYNTYSYKFLVKHRAAPSPNDNAAYSAPMELQSMIETSMNCHAVLNPEETTYHLRLKARTTHDQDK